MVSINIVYRSNPRRSKEDTYTLVSIIEHTLIDKWPMVIDGFLLLDFKCL